MLRGSIAHVETVLVEAEIIERLARAHVGVAGCGGLGSTLAVALARAGVGTLTLVDFDVVEPRNLSRQQYFVEQVGEPKVEALAANLGRINPRVALRLHRLRLTSADVSRLFSDCSVVAECFDVPSAKAELSTAMRRELPGIPMVGVSGLAGLGPASAISSRRVFRHHFLVGDGVSSVESGQGLFAPGSPWPRAIRPMWSCGCCLESWQITTGSSMKIIVNGEGRDVAAGLSLRALLDQIGTSAERVAIECNGVIIESRDLETMTLQADDKLEIVHFVGGG